jgi:hypothetical protein
LIDDYPTKSPRLGSKRWRRPPNFGRTVEIPRRVGNQAGYGICSAASAGEAIEHPLGVIQVNPSEYAPYPASPLRPANF